MNRSIILVAVSSLIAVFSLAGCAGGETDLEEDAAPRMTSQAYGLSGGGVEWVADKTVALSYGGDFDDVSGTSPLPSVGDYVVEVDDASWPDYATQAYARGPENISQSTCKATIMTAMLFGWDGVTHSWYQIGSTKSQYGTWVEGPYFVGCDNFVSWPIPLGVETIRIKGHATTYGPVYSVGQQITEGARYP